jgi:UPF0755 protein
MKRFSLLIIGVAFLLLVFLFLAFGLFCITPAKHGAPTQLIIIKEGLSLKDVADELDRRGIVTNGLLFEMWAKFMGASRLIKAGEYRLGPGMAPIRILKKLKKGEIISHAVTIPEGLTKGQIAELLAEKVLVDKRQFLLLSQRGELLDRYGMSVPSLEGFLYPETYHFARGLSAPSVIDTMIQRFWHVIDPLRDRIEGSGMTLFQVITLASIVEKETGNPKERPLIASVFLNRMKKGMRLESDPTVIYGLDQFNGNLTRKDLETYTPYNTYKIKGLPPGPIANPGLESITAVLHPARTEYLYFVSKNDGSHHFSKTLSEHNRAVRTYQKHRSRRSGKIP